jgi:hypothetical protein
MGKAWGTATRERPAQEGLGGSITAHPESEGVKHVWVTTGHREPNVQGQGGPHPSTSTARTSPGLGLSLGPGLQ